MTADQRPDRDRLRLAAVLAGCSAVIHVAAGLEHLDEWWVFAVIFLGTSVLQGWWAVVVWRRGATASRRLLCFGAAVALGVAATWVASRTSGLPLGPGRWRAESVGVLDAQSTANEVLSCVLVVPTLLGTWRGRQLVYCSEALALAAVCATFFVLAAGVGHEH